LATLASWRFNPESAMSIHHVNTISQRLSLRAPQRDALKILDRVCEIVALAKDTDPAIALSTLRSEFPTVEDFEREFLSLCFALATGVGKTRLMGAFITYLYWWWTSATFSSSRRT